MTEAATVSPTLRIYQLLRAAVLDVPTDDAAPAEVADAMQMLALEFAETLVDPVTIARVLTRQAERYFEKGRREARGPVTAPKAFEDDLRGTFNAAVAVARRNHAEPVVQAVMLAFVAAWLRRTAGPHAAAGQLYAQADALATSAGRLN